MPTTANPVTIGPVSIGRGRPLALIAGPCVMEPNDMTRIVAERLVTICDRLKVPLVFKASFDKANRSSGKSYRGLGMDEGLRVLSDVKRETGLPVTTDVHESVQVSAVAEVVDLLQIPAFLARQTDLVVAAAKTGRAVNVKKGQFMAPWDMRNVVAKTEEVGNPNLLLTERGTTFGYGNLVNDMRAIPWMQDLGRPVIFDATHSVQLPGGAGDASGGQPQFIETLSRAAVAAGVDGLFVEVHDEPELALSDGSNALRLDRLAELLRRLRALDSLVKSQEFLHG
jgi:2-dehydro-3-deoxyphosphooctonate aldolase (KDO 8-P synthase)